VEDSDDCAFHYPRGEMQTQPKQRDVKISAAVVMVVQTQQRKVSWDECTWVSARVKESRRRYFQYKVVRDEGS
jgi:hypothetical protein